MRYKYSIEELKEAVKQSKSIANVLRLLNVRPVGGNYKTVKSLISKYNIDISHFTGQGWNVGLKFKPFKKFKDEEIFVENSSYKSTVRLKERYKNLKSIDYCEICGIKEWNNKPLSFEIHHINGINTDNRIENLQLLCPNCHSQTESFRGKSKLSALSEMKEVEYRKFKEALTDNADGNLEPSLINKEGAETRHGKPKSKKILEPKYCLHCGKELVGKERRQKYCSVECYRKDTKGKRPSVFELLEAFKQYKSFIQVGKHYNVTDNAIRKWVQLYQIEDMVKE
jgi:hypothetical protein